MGTVIPASNGLQSSPASYRRSLSLTLSTPTEAKSLVYQEKVDFGKNGQVGNQKAMSMVLERAMEKLRSVVTDAKKALGMSDSDVIDTSPEATAGRIADFAIGAFSSWQKNHTDLSEDDARKQFSDFIGAAIQEGISQARGILTALNSLTGDVNTNIDTTWNIIQQRLDDFVAGKGNTQQTMTETAA
jgi:hypothetical protein